jgi:hypothetical protein
MRRLADEFGTARRPVRSMLCEKRMQMLPGSLEAACGLGDQRPDGERRASRRAWRRSRSSGKSSMRSCARRFHRGTRSNPFDSQSCRSSSRRLPNRIALAGFANLCAGLKISRESQRHFGGYISPPRHELRNRPPRRAEFPVFAFAITLKRFELIARRQRGFRL